MPRGSGKRRSRLFQVDDETEETGTGAEAAAAPVEAEPPAQTPARVFRRPTPTTPATQNTAHTRREETHRCDPYLPINTQTGAPSTGMFLMLISAWLDKGAFSEGIQRFLLKGDYLKWIGDRNDPRGKGYQMRIISPPHVRANPPVLFVLFSLPAGGAGDFPRVLSQSGQLIDYKIMCVTGDNGAKLHGLSPKHALLHARLQSRAQFQPGGTVQATHLGLPDPLNPLLLREPVCYS